MGAVRGANDRPLTTGHSTLPGGRRDADGTGLQASRLSRVSRSRRRSGGVFEPVPEPGRTGTLTQTFEVEDVADIQSVNATIFRAAGPDFREVASTTLTQPASGWTMC